jgi:uncharacterized membrane protein YfcA
MHVTHTGFQAAYAVSGLLVGVLVGLTGVGGGSLMTPLLVLLFGFNPSTAVGTDLLFAAVTKTVGTTIHSAGKTVDWRIVGRLACGSVPATILTLLALAHFGVENKKVSLAISLTLGVTLLISAILLVFRNKIIAAGAKRDAAAAERTSLWATVLVGFVVGVLVSLSSVGAGALGTVALFFLYPRLPVVRIVGSDIAHAVPLTLLAGLGHWFLGTINFHLLGSLLVGSVPGIVIGSYAARYTPDAVLKYALATVLTLVGIKLLSTV